MVLETQVVPKYLILEIASIPFVQRVCILFADIYLCICINSCFFCIISYNRLRISPKLCFSFIVQIYYYTPLKKKHIFDYKISPPLNLSPTRLNQTQSLIVNNFPSGFFSQKNFLLDIARGSRHENFCTRWLWKHVKYFEFQLKPYVPFEDKISRSQKVWRSTRNDETARFAILQVKIIAKFREFY